MRIVVDNCWAYFEHADGVFGLVDSVTSFMAKGRFFHPAYKSGAWNGQKRLREFDRTRKLYRIPTGLLSRVLEVIDAAGHQYQLQDDRFLDVPTAVYGFPDGSELRPYQRDALDAVLARGRGVVKIPTGGGKTQCGAALIASYAPCQTIWLTDRAQLMYQSQRRLERLLKRKVGLLGDGEQDIQDVTVCMVKTFLNRRAELADYIQKVQLLILDEAHHAQADTWYEAIQEIPAPYRIALTATPCFGQDGLRLLGVTGEIATEVSTKQLIDLGFLINPKCRFLKYEAASLPKKLDYRSVRKRGILECKERNDKILDKAWELQLENIPTMTLVREVSHGKKLLYDMVQAGIRADYIHGDTSQPERDRLLERFEAGKLHHLVASTQILGEGFDCPRLTALINATGTRGGGSKASGSDDEVGRVTIQAIGRAIRPMPGKTEAFYYDFTDVSHPDLKKATKDRVSALEEEGYTDIDFE